jgi:hypothetical protein
MECTDRPARPLVSVPFSPNGPSGPTQQDFNHPPPVGGLRDGGVDAFRKEPHSAVAATDQGSAVGAEHNRGGATGVTGKCHWCDR